MTDQETDGVLPTAEERALQAIISVAGAHDRSEFATVPKFCDEAVLSQIIALSWRHQFDESRVAFRRGIVELQTYVAGRIKLSIEDR